MPNIVKGQVPLTLSDGRSLTLVLDFDALVEAEGAYRKPLGALMADASAGFVGAVRALLYGALRSHHPEMSLRDAGDLFSTDADAIKDALAHAGDAAFPKEGKEGPNPPVKTQRGKTSGRSGAKRA
jgi:hypothetical protein